MRRVGWILLLASLTNCGGGNVPSQPDSAVRSKRVSAAREGLASSIAWLPDGSIVLSLGSDAARESSRLWSFRLEVPKLKKLPLGHDRACRRTVYVGPETLPDGRLGYTRHCDALDERSDLIGTSAYYAYDVDSREAERLASLGPAGTRRRFGTVLEQDWNPTAVTWNPELSEAIVSVDAICATLGHLSTDGIGPLRGPLGDVVLRDDGVSWNLAEPLMENPDESCSSSGRASAPAWSPDGETVAFLASPAAVGVEGPERLHKPSNLYVMAPGEWSPRRELGAINDDAGSSLSWSPDGKWLLMTAGLGDHEYGLWIYSPDENVLHLISESSVRSAAWSPDGRRIIATVDPTPQTFDDEPSFELWAYEVGALV
jgi:WD40 repeat protein